ncbi:MAG: hypothetical protein QXW80_06315 [Candidatus Micrarchaeia archaeon]
MSRIKATFILALLLTTVFTAFFPLAVKASTGYILINKKVGPSPSPSVAAGANISLYFGGVTFSGGQFYLVWSSDGFSQISSGDFRYSPVFNVADLIASGSKGFNYTLGEQTLKFNIGYGWVNGSTPQNIAGGKYYVKAFDGSATSVAVTDNYITILPALEVTPTSGPGGCALTLKGFAFTANSYVNLTYQYDTTSVTIKNLTATDSMGRFTYSVTAQDLKIETSPSLSSAGDTWLNQPITFYAQDNETTYTAEAVFTEYARGLIQVGGYTPSAGNLYGNGTDFTGAGFPNGLDLKVFDELIIAGNYFYPGNVNILVDGKTLIGKVLANGTGFFNTTVTIPPVAQGKHNITLVDANSVNFVFWFNVIPTLVLVPSQGIVGATVTAKAYAFPANTAVYIYWFEKSWGDKTYYWMANATTGDNGQFNVTVTFKVPNTYGGEHKVNASSQYFEETTSLGGVIAGTSFTVEPSLTISPSSFANDGSKVTVVGTGLDPTIEYCQNIDNQRALCNLKANGTGYAKVEFIAAGFNPGLHVYSLYNGTSGLEAYVLFTVTGVSPDTQTILNNLATLSNSVDALKTTLTQGIQNIRNDISSVKSDLATLSDSMSNGFTSVNNAIGTLTTSVGNLGNTLSGQITNLGNTLSKSISDNANSLSSQISSLGNTLSKSISDNANSIQTSIKNAQDATVSQVKSSVGDISTFLIIIGILAAITLVVEVAILLRRLS